MFPVLEMAGHRVEWVREIVYVYNVQTPYQDHKQSVAEQHAAAAFLRSLPKYRRLSAARVVQRAPVVTAWFEGCPAVSSSSSSASPAHADALSSRCLRPMSSAQLTLLATGIWVPEEAVLLLEVFDASGVLQGGHEANEQQLTLQLGGGFDPGLYSVVVSLMPLHQEGVERQYSPFAEVKIALTLQ